MFSASLFAKGLRLFPVVFLIFVAVPIIEIAILIKVGGLIGVWPTLALVIGVAIFGTWLLRQQGLQTFTKAQQAMNRGEMPVGELLDGFFLVLAALLMVTPGLMTDAFGFALLVPIVRKWLGLMLRNWVMAKGAHVQFYQANGAPPSSPPSGRGPVIDGEASKVDDDKDDRTHLPPHTP